MWLGIMLVQLSGGYRFSSTIYDLTSPAVDQVSSTRHEFPFVEWVLSPNRELLVIIKECTPLLPRQGYCAMLIVAVAHRWHRMGLLVVSLLWKPAGLFWYCESQSSGRGLSGQVLRASGPSKLLLVLVFIRANQDLCLPPNATFACFALWLPLGLQKIYHRNSRLFSANITYTFQHSILLIL